ncbi:hypothetical protein STCU_01280 [Strigomonas culicis]|uniref:Staphylococcal nuclease domain-containing protein 1 n=1 Tax=Strigomonas culicis TaxID=28005 RepID=S9WGZ8_9TRYP|nr:hypothetical protein STCU_01280 [Strigomonas culicis]|eukprot:EPY35040.1 hypothetical protein STCU_01280 [Strigomonas culicis]
MISIVSKNGSFQEELLSKGFVKLHNATLPLSAYIEALQKAEAAARDKRLGTWRNYTPPEEANTKVVAHPSAPTAEGLPTTLPDGTPGPFYKGPLSFEGTLAQVVQADILVVEENATGKMVRLSLAGVRCPRGVTRDHDGNSSETRVTYDDYTWESREFVRTSYIGQNVSVQIEYARVIPESKEVRPAASITVTSNGANIGAALIEKGYAHFFLGKTDLCSCAALLQSAEETAKTAGLALHSGRKNLPQKVVELNRLGEARAKYYLNFLQRGMQGGRPPVLAGVVDLVLGSSSLRVYIPKENFQIPVKVAGVITPQTAFNPRETADPLSEEAKNFVIRLVQQREVNVQVYTSDRGGNFISAVTLKDGTNLSVALVEAGFATVGNADRLPFCQQLADAEDEARSAGLNIWAKEGGGIPQRAAKLAAERVASNPHKLARVLDETAEFTPYTFTEVGEDSLSVYLQSNSEATLQAMQKVQPLLEKTVASGEYHPKKDELVVALYEADSMWCRGKIVKLHKGASTADVHYVDFGNTETVPFAKIRAIPPNAHYDIVRNTPPAVILAKLAFVKVFPGEDSVADAAADCIYDYAQGEILAKAVYKDATGSSYYTVTKNVNVSSLSETLLQRGIVLLDKRTATVDVREYKRHEAAKEIARKGHKGIWQYGDVDDGNEDDDN